MTHQPLTTFGKDHWSLLAYLVTRFEEPIRFDRLRINAAYHPLHAHAGGWDDRYTTRLTGGAVAPPGHDDLHCLEDLEREGIVHVLSLNNGFFKITPVGWLVAYDLLEHKRKGGGFALFKAPEFIDNRLESVERFWIRWTLRVERFKTRAAQSLGIDRTTLQNKIERYGLKPETDETRIEEGKEAEANDERTTAG